MQPEIIYKLNETDFKKAIAEELKELTMSVLFGQFAGRLVSVDAAAEIHGVHRDTILRYVKAGLIECQHSGKLYKFNLTYILNINLHDLKKQTLTK